MENQEISEAELALGVKNLLLVAPFATEITRKSKTLKPHPDGHHYYLKQGLDEYFKEAVPWKRAKDVDPEKFIEITTTHKFVKFKPPFFGGTIREILEQIPKKYFGKVAALELDPKKITWDTPNLRHLAKVKLYLKNK